MAKPRTFVSSTFFDLADARAALKAYLKEVGHEPLMHEDPNFGVSPGKHSHVACLDQVDNADYFVMIIGGRRGGTYVGGQRSITNEEYKRALNRKIPIFIFVKKAVDEAHRHYKRNPGGDFSAAVDDKRIFDFVDLVRSQSEDNWTWSFDTVEDVIAALKGQFAHIHLLFSQQHVKQRSGSRGGGKDERQILPFSGDLPALSDGDPPEVAASLTAGVRKIHRALAKMIESKASGFDEKAKVLWILGRYGTVDDDAISMPEPSFKQYAWGMTKGRRVFDQLEDFGIIGDYHEPWSEDGKWEVRLRFDKDEGGAVEALKRYVAALTQRHGDDGIDLLMKMDLSVLREAHANARKPKAK